LRAAYPRAHESIDRFLACRLVKKNAMGETSPDAPAETEISLIQPRGALLAVNASLLDA
jgi:hypothetical protein